MIQELKDIKKIQKIPDGIFGSFMTRPFSPFFAYMLDKIHISPNGVSFLSFFFCAASVMVLSINSSFQGNIIAIMLWWMAAILDAADGDLARYTNRVSAFGGWFDSFLDRLKELLIFAALGYLAYKRLDSELYLLLGFLALSANIMSGWISDTKKLFIEKRVVEIQLGRKYSFGMVDTRDFLIILSLAFDNYYIILILYSFIFLFIIPFQVYRLKKLVSRNKPA